MGLDQEELDAMEEEEGRFQGRRCVSLRVHPLVLFCVSFLVHSDD